MQQSIIYESQSKKIDVSLRNYFFYFAFFVISFFAPLMVLALIKQYAAHSSIPLEVGCEGPEMFCGLLSGVLMALQLKFFQAN